MKAVVAAFNQEKALVHSRGLLRDYEPSDSLRLKHYFTPRANSHSRRPTSGPGPDMDWSCHNDDDGGVSTGRDMWGPLAVGWLWLHG